MTVYQFARRGILLVYTVLIAVPLLIVITGSIKTNQDLFSHPFSLPLAPVWSNYPTVLGGQNLARAFLNSVIVTAVSVTVTVFLCSLVGYAVARIPGWRGYLVYGIFVVGMAVPAQVSIVPQYVLFDRLGLLDSLTGLALVNVVQTAPVGVFIIAGFMKTLPRELYESADLDGSNHWRTYRSIVIPLSAPSLAAAAIFLSVMHWNELMYPLYFIHDPDKRTLPLALLNFRGEYFTDYPLLFTGILIASAPMVVAYVFLQRYFVAGMTAGAIKA